MSLVPGPSGGQASLVGEKTGINVAGNAHKGEESDNTLVPRSLGDLVSVQIVPGTFLCFFFLWEWDTR